MKKVLLTGSGGFIGRHAIADLLARGYEVHAVTSGTGRFPWESADKIVNHPCDLLNPSERKRLIEAVRPTHLLHFAWVTTHGKFWTAAENLKWVAASLGLLDEFISCGGKRTVFAGTCAEYEWKDEVLSEAKTPLRPATLYGVCKNSLQAIFSTAAAQAGISAAWGRIFFLYGPFEAQTRFVPAVILPLLRGEPAQLSHCRQIRDFLHVEDVARAFVATLDSEVQGPINIASGIPVSLRHVVDIIADLLRRPDLIRIGTRPQAARDPIRLVADVSRLRAAVGFSPKYSLETGLVSAIRWWERSAAECIVSVTERIPRPQEKPELEASDLLRS